MVDDGSTDKSRIIIDKYSGRVKKIYKSNGGQASAFNAGFEHSTGDIVLFLDSDDILYSNALSKIKKNWKEGSSRCHFRLNIIDSDGRLQPGGMPKINEKLCTGDVFQWQLYGGKPGYSIVPTSGNAFCRSVLKKVFPIDERFRICADAYLFYSSAKYGEVYAIEEILGAYRKHQSNHFSTSYVIKQMPSHKSLELLKNQITNIHIRISFLNQLNKECKYSSWFWINNMSLYNTRELFVGKMLDVAGPLQEIENQFPIRRIVILIIFAVFAKHNTCKHWIRTISDIIIMPLLGKKQRIEWTTQGAKYLFKTFETSFAKCKKRIGFKIFHICKKTNDIK